MAHNIGKVLGPSLEDRSGLILRKKPCRSQWVGSGASLVRISVAGLRIHARLSLAIHEA